MILTDFSYKIQVNIKSSVLTYGMRQTGGEHEWDTVWERYQNESSSAEKNRLASCLAQTPHPWLLWR